MRKALLLFLLAGCSKSSDHPPQNQEVLELDGMTFRRVSPSRYGRPGPDFYLLETEVTNREFARYLEATGGKKLDEDLEAQVKAKEEDQRRTGTVSGSTGDAVVWIKYPALLWRKGKPAAGMEEHPVALINVHEAAEYCEWLTKRFPDRGTFRFPTVDEWITAAYGAGRPCPWGEPAEPSRALFNGSGTEPVRARPDGRSPEGIYGLWGNVSEFVIHPSEVRDTHFRGVGGRWMGGDFADKAASPRQDYWGYWHNDEGRAQDIGFRVLLDPTDRGHRFKHQTPYDGERR